MENCLNLSEFLICDTNSNSSKYSYSVWTKYFTIDEKSVNIRVKMCKYF